MKSEYCINAGLSLPASIVRRLKDHAVKVRTKPSVIVRELLEKFLEEADGSSKTD